MIVSTTGTCGGEPRIDNHRITVENILGQLFETNEGLNMINFAYPTLSNKEIGDVKDYVYKLLEEKIK